MTTADIALGFSEFGWWLFSIEERLTGMFHAIIDWAVDRYGWVRHGLARRRRYPSGQHRDGGENGFSVWEYLHERVPLEELEYVWKPRGQHRDNRGWRYASMVWHTIARSAEYRDWAEYWSAETNRLMDEIQWMFDHPPSAASVTVHGCQDCLCGQISAIRQEALA